MQGAPGGPLNGGGPFEGIAWGICMQGEWIKYSLHYLQLSFINVNYG